MSSEPDNTNLQEQEAPTNVERGSQRRAFGLTRQIFAILIRHVLSLTVLIVTLRAFQYLLGKYYAEPFEKLARVFGPHKFAFLGVVGIGLVGVGLYIIRQRWRVQYGLLEIAFALVYGFSALLRVGEKGYTEILGVVAAVYLVVRGVDNLMIGLNKSFERAKPHLETPKQYPADH